MMGRRILVTGAASGIGRSVALLAATREPDLSLGLVDRDPVGLTTLAEEVTALGVRCVTVAADLATAKDPVRAVREVERELGGIDVLISNAGSTRPGTLLDTQVEDWQWSFDLNARATWLMAKAAYEALVGSGGSIVVTTSISGHHPTPNAGAYSVSKAALLMLVRHLALEWGPDGVRVNSVSPGPVDTSLTHASFGDPVDARARERRRQRESLAPLRKIGTADEVAEVVLFLAGAAASHVTGADIPVDGGLGLTLMPGARNEG